MTVTTLLRGQIAKCPNLIGIIGGTMRDEHEDYRQFDDIGRRAATEYKPPVIRDPRGDWHKLEMEQQDELTRYRLGLIPKEHCCLVVKTYINRHLTSES